MSATQRLAIWPRSRLLDRQKREWVMTAGLARARVTGRWVLCGRGRLALGRRQSFFRCRRLCAEAIVSGASACQWTTTTSAGTARRSGAAAARRRWFRPRTQPARVWCLGEATHHTAPACGTDGGGASEVYARGSVNAEIAACGSVWSTTPVVDEAACSSGCGVGGGNGDRDGGGARRRRRGGGRRSGAGPAMTSSPMPPRRSKPRRATRPTSRRPNTRRWRRVTTKPAG